MSTFPDIQFDEAIGTWLPVRIDSHLYKWETNAEPDLKLFWARNQTHDYPPHLHLVAELLFVHEGQVDLTCRGETHRLRAGDVYLISPQELHGNQIVGSNGLTFTLIHVPASLYWETARTAFGQQGLGALTPVCVAQGKQLLPRLNALSQMLVSTCEIQPFEDLLAAMMLHVFSASHEDLNISSKPHHFAIAAALKLMQEEQEDELKVDDIAQQVGLNTRYFISLFKQSTGLPPHQYLIALRVERARQLLQDTAEPICDVALTSGFNDQSHLNRYFKRSYGFTPGGLKRLITPI